ncbi:hypothetical protein B7463_g5480, partial [Scytalidium lignicola]
MTPGSDSDDDYDLPLPYEEDSDEEYSVPCPSSTYFTTPRSRSNDFVYAFSTYNEKTALKQLLQGANHIRSPVNGRDNLSSPEIELTDFVIYLPDDARHPFEFSGLQNLSTKKGHDTLLFDGVLKKDDSSYHVKAVPFGNCYIGNYGPKHHSVNGEISIQSVFSAKSNPKILYKLKSPAKEYKRYYEGFLWLADLTKHFIDFGQSTPAPISTNSFRVDFSRWLTETHGNSEEFNTWFQRYGRNDFRTAVATNISFLSKEAIRIDKRRFKSQPVFAELLHMTAIPEKKTSTTKTTVTQYVYDCFSHLPFGGHLKPLSMRQSVKRRWEKNLEERNFIDIPLQSTSSNLKRKSREDAPNILTDKQIKHIKIGDILAVITDGEDSLWKDEPSNWKEPDKCWYMYVQGICKGPDGKCSFDGIWLYRPSDTSCARMKYPFPNELFFSDHCTCETGPIPQDEVLRVESVDFHVSTSNELLFIRQAYIEGEKFETLTDRHKVCQHRSNNTHTIETYKVGQPVLAKPRDSIRLEAYEVVGYEQQALDSRIVILRRLLRRVEVEPNSSSRPNELVYSDQIERLSVGRVKGKCHIRFYAEDIVRNGFIPVPYNRDGTGNMFYISTRLDKSSGVTELQPIHNDQPQSLIQGFDPQASLERAPMRGLDLCHGSGNFGRGVAEGGAVINKYACDNSSVASHTYIINDPHPSETKMFLGSMDDLLAHAIQGHGINSKVIPQPGDIDHMTAGSPCKGFSLLNTHRSNEKGLKDQSLIASVAAHIDFYRPKYGLIENVLNMANKLYRRDEDVLSQLICAIVGLGYQLQVFVLDAWSCGSPQSRSRIFVSFAAPGLHPLDYPALSHSHPPNTTRRAVGVIANGQPFGHRRNIVTPFKFTSAGFATADLPDIGDGHPRHCTPFPDHVMAKSLTEREYVQINAIPTQPRGMSFGTAWDNGDGVMTEEERDLFPSSHTKHGSVRENVRKGSRAWGRVHPKKIFSTVVVQLNMEDARVGSCLHWDQLRYITIQEARRAQGFPDDEVLVGKPAQKMELIGNAVARQVALALGLATRFAYLHDASDSSESVVDSSSIVETMDNVSISSPEASQMEAVSTINSVLAGNKRRRGQEEIASADDVQGLKKARHSVSSMQSEVIIPLNSDERLSEPREIIDISSDSDNNSIETITSKQIDPYDYIDLTSDNDDW